MHAGRFVDDLHPEAYGEAGGLNSQAGNKGHRDPRDGEPDAPESAAKLRAADYISCNFGKTDDNIIGVYCADSADVRPELLARVTGLHHLRKLWVEAKFTDSDLGFVKSLTTLESLDLGGTRLADQGLVNLRNLSRLQELRLPKWRFVTDAGLANLAALTELRSLYLDGTGVHGEGLKNLKGMTKLFRLSLTNSAVDDDSLAIIGSLASVTVLDLAGTKVTDEGLLRLSGLSGLTCLNLYETQITRAGGERLTTKLPKLDILYPFSQRKESELGPPFEKPH